jgi:hypothetical protein
LREPLSQSEEHCIMPVIDVYVPSDLFPDGVDREVAEDLTSALQRAEGVRQPAFVQLNNTAAYIHRPNPKAVHTAGTASARTVRIQVLTGSRAIRRKPRERGCSSLKRPRGAGALRVQPSDVRNSRRSPGNSPQSVLDTAGVEQ